jgi:hypothetical protein
LQQIHRFARIEQKKQEAAVATEERPQAEIKLEKSAAVHRPLLLTRIEKERQILAD